MQIYEINCSLTNDGYESDSEVIESLSNKYNIKNIDSHLIFVSELTASNITLCCITNSIKNNTNKIKSIIENFLNKNHIEYSSMDLEEVTLSRLYELYTQAHERGFLDEISHKFIDDNMELENLLVSEHPNIHFDDNVLSCIKKKVIYEETKKYDTEYSLKEELDRIYSLKTIQKFIGHPTHYLLLDDDKEERRETYKLLLNALYEKNRICTKRYVFLNLRINSNCIDRKAINNLYNTTLGGTVVIRVDSDDVMEDPSESSAISWSIYHICNIVKKYKNKVLTVLCLPHMDELVDIFKTNLTGLSFVEISDDISFNYDSARDFLTKKAIEKGFEPEESLYQKLIKKVTYSRKALEAIFQDYCDCKEVKKVFVNYKDVKALEAKVEEKEDTDEKGSAYDELMSMIGIKSAKEIANKAINYYKAQKLFKDKGMNTSGVSMHMVFTGNPGTAKTTVARLLAQIMKDNGVLKKGHMVEVGRAGLVGKYVGHTAKLVVEKFEAASGGVLFIDEAYSLIDEKEGSYGDEAINTIVQEMENHRDDVMVIFAGYPDKMKEFISRNPGLKSRIAFHLSFEDYSVDELCDIAKFIGNKQGFVLADDAMEKLRIDFTNAKQMSDFGNGRYVRNIIENAKIEQASRLLEMNYDEVTKEDVTTLVAADIICGSIATTPKKRIGFGE